MKENEHWKLEKGGKYFFTKNNTTLFGFRVGKQYDPAKTGFKLIVAHTDSPNLRFAPNTKLKAAGYE